MNNPVNAENTVKRSRSWPCASAQGDARSGQVAAEEGVVFLPALTALQSNQASSGGVSDGFGSANDVHLGENSFPV